MSLRSPKGVQATDWTFHSPFQTFVPPTYIITSHQCCVLLCKIILGAELCCWCAQQVLERLELGQDTLTWMSLPLRRPSERTMPRQPGLKRTRHYFLNSPCVTVNGDTAHSGCGSLISLITCICPVNYPTGLTASDLRRSGFQQAGSR